MAGNRWNGSAFVGISTKKRWNGSAWVDLTVAKRWNGSLWVDIFPTGSVFSFATSDPILSEAYSCDGDSCPLTVSISDTDTYTLSGGVAPYTVSAVVSTGPAITLNVATPNQITATASLGRSVSKVGEVKVTITDSDSPANTEDFYVPFSFSYVYSRDGKFPPFPPDPPRDIDDIPLQEV